MIQAIYLTEEEYNKLVGQASSEFSIFCPIQDDQTGQFYITDLDLNLITVFEFFIMLKDLPKVPLPEHEYYKFKIQES
jgi:hypothetical protein